MTFQAEIHDVRRSRRNEALLRTVMVHGVPVRTLATVLGVSRQTIYRRMQQARVQMRRLADAAERRADD
ncbi:MAG: HTH domain-containing protein [Planctomycetes bacterium]|nr:HTH domain-containing protein [Planctomycetota bacterium]